MNYELQVNFEDKQENKYTLEELEKEIRRVLERELYLNINSFKLKLTV